MEQDTNLMTWGEFAIETAQLLGFGFALGTGAYAGWAACAWLFGG
jgi:hypothetical protein